MEVFTEDYRIDHTDLFNNRVVCQSNSLLVNFSIAPLVDQFSNTLQIRVPEVDLQILRTRGAGNEPYDNQCR